MREFQLLLRRIAPLAKQLAAIVGHIESDVGGATITATASAIPTMETIIQEIKMLLVGVDESYFWPEIQLPSTSKARQQLRDPIYHCGLIETYQYETSIFGFREVGAHIPLHNHPHMFGFLKVLKGRIRILSYSFLDTNERNALFTENNVSIFSNKQTEASSLHLVDAQKRRWPVRYEGSIVLSAFSNIVAHLEPLKHNIHMVQALDDGAAFFDLLVPGYKYNECIYYKPINDQFLPKITDKNNLAKNESSDALSNNNQLELCTNIGDILWLHEIDEPPNLQMQRLEIATCLQ